VMEKSQTRRCPQPAQGKISSAASPKARLAEALGVSLRSAAAIFLHSLSAPRCIEGPFGQQEPAAVRQSKHTVQGWIRRMSPANRHNERRNRDAADTAYRRGQEAYGRGGGADIVNPYLPGTPFYKAFEQGVAEARQFAKLGKSDSPNPP
jgi:hypothetical protein